MKLLKLSNRNIFHNYVVALFQFVRLFISWVYSHVFNQLYRLYYYRRRILNFIFNQEMDISTSKRHFYSAVPTAFAVKQRGQFLKYGYFPYYYTIYEASDQHDVEVLIT